MRLYNYYRSSTSYRVRIALNIKGLGYDYVPVNLKAGDHLQSEFSSITPYQTVPVLEVEGQLFKQSLAILDWLELSYPEPALMPKDLSLRQTCKELYYAIATEVHAPNNLSVLKYLKSQFGIDQDGLEAWNEAWIQRTFAAIEAQLEALDWVSDTLPFGQISLFEVVLIPQMYNARRWNCDLGPFSSLRRIEEVCQTLDAFVAAHPDKQPDTVEIRN